MCGVCHVCQYVFIINGTKNYAACMFVCVGVREICVGVACINNFVSSYSILHYVLCTTYEYISYVHCFVD